MRVRGGVTPFGKAERKGVFGAVSACCGSLCGVVPRCRKRQFYGVGTMSEREDYEINLRQLSKELNQYQGNLWTVIISLSREDAERLGFDTAARWRDFLRSERSEIAEQFHIPQGNLRWYAAFHNEKHHPHVHLMVWSEDEKEGYLSERGIEKLRSSFAKSIFAQDWCNIYDHYTEARNTLRQESRERMREIIRAINAGSYENKTIEHLLLQLARQLSATTGKKQYGYLKPELKRLVDAIVTEFSKDPRIAELYDLWYDDPDRHPITRIDRKQRRKIDEKKLAQGMRLE